MGIHAGHIHYIQAPEREITCYGRTWKRSVCWITYSENGSIMHQQRQSRVFKEMVASIMVNFSVNILLLSPLILLGFNIFERHAILINSIGAFQPEIEAFEQIKVMISIGYALLLLLTVTQLITYYLYNGKFHPFSIIVSSQRQTLHTPMRKQESESAEDFLFLFEDDTLESSDC